MNRSLCALGTLMMLLGCGTSPLPPHVDAPSEGGPDAASEGPSDGPQGSVTPPTIDKVDILFMIDNAASMADKQQVLADAVPDLINRLMAPICIDPMGQPVANQPAAGDPCPGSSYREFDAIVDIHLGIVSSSLGSHGADTCTDTGRDNNDKGHLVTRGRAGAMVTTWNGNGFLAWDPNGNRNVPPGEASGTNLINTFADMVVGTDQVGCGFGAQLESWYRFLIEPDPPNAVSAAIPSAAVRSGRDEALLAQRAAFLRPDSLVAIIALTDENDCSVMEGGLSYLSLVSPNKGHLIKKGTKICQSNPNDPCCFNCGQTPPAGCNNDPATDPNCQANGGVFTDAEDPIALRCFQQKNKFGIDFLYPVQRYVDGLTKATIFNAMGQAVGNPLFMDLQNTGNSPRDPGLVFFAGIVGVPWQDIAVDPTDLTKGYLPTKADPSVPGQQDLNSAYIWPIILGDPAASPPITPSDSLMIESIDPRSSVISPRTNPRTNDRVAGLGSAANASKINGHEWDTNQPTVQSGLPRSDLQYACIFKKTTPQDCAQLDPLKDSCDCFDSTADAIQNPLCQDLTTNAYGKIQYRAKAYPGVRELQVLKGIGQQAIVASICPADLTSASKSSGSATYGYRPAVRAILDRVKRALRR
jgi:hypothetical protein